MGRSFLAIFFGIIIAHIVIGSIEWVGYQVYPIPPDIDITDMNAVSEWVANLPIGSFFIVLLAWFLGTSAGTAWAARFEDHRPMLHACIVGGIMLALGIKNMQAFEHPLWFQVLGVLVFPAAIAAGHQLAKRPPESGPGPKAHTQH
jgi:hypothetical protein